MNLNWRDASKELPESDYGCNDLLLVIENKYIETGNYKTPSKYNDKDYMGFFSWRDDDGCREEFYGNSEVTRWLPIDEIPLPEE